MSSFLRRVERKADRAKADRRHMWLASQHEAAHAVVALAVGADLESVRLAPTPQVGVLTEDLDLYQTAAITVAGPLADAALGLTPRGPQDAGYVAWIAEPPSKDWLMFASCCWQAVGLEPGRIVGLNCDGIPLAERRAPEEYEEHGPAMNAWAAAVSTVTAHICQANTVQIAKLAGALLAHPAPLSVEQVRAACGALTTITPERLRETTDDLALRGLGAGEVSWREHKRLWPRMTWHGWDQIDALKVVQPCQP